MTFDVALLALGGLFLLVGLAGRVKVRSLEVGTSSRWSRTVAGFVGLFLLVVALSDYLGLPALTGAKEKVEQTIRRVPAKYAVVLSTKSLTEARRAADKLHAAGEAVQVYESSTGYLAIAIPTEGRDFESLKNRLITEGLAQDAYPSIGDGFLRLVYSPGQ